MSHPLKRGVDSLSLRSPVWSGHSCAPVAGSMTTICPATRLLARTCSTDTSKAMVLADPILGSWRLPRQKERVPRAAWYFSHGCVAPFLWLAPQMARTSIQGCQGNSGAGFSNKDQRIRWKVAGLLSPRSALFLIALRCPHRLFFASSRAS